MNALFLTQSRSLDMFYKLAQALRLPLGLDRVGFLVADRRNYRRFQRQHPEIESNQFHVLKEWEFVQRARGGEPNLERLRAREQALGESTLWASLVADRRVSSGPLCVVRQDYRLRFGHLHMMRILEEGLNSTEHLFDEVKPDVVFSFICVTLGEFLAYLVARQHGIRILNLRPTRIQNYVTFAPTIFEPSEMIRTAYQLEFKEQIEDEVTREARTFIGSMRCGNSMYEGVISPSRKPPQVPKKFSFSLRLPKGVFDSLRREVDYYISGDYEDNHLLDPFTSLLYSRFINPWRASWVNRQLVAGYVKFNDLRSLDYVFFPLHTEPEVSLLVHSRSYLNQIEVVRNLAQYLPVGMHVVVKEHPWSVGKRPLSYYQKLLQIPNVRLADPGLNSTPLIENARLVATIAGSIGFEAAVLRKPVIIWGHTPYEMLPNMMVRRVTDPERLGLEIQDMLANYSCDEHALVRYVTATLRHSARVNLYSGLLGREGVYVPDSGTEDRTDIERMAALVTRTILSESGIKNVKAR